MKLLIVDTEATDIIDPIVCEIAVTLYQVGSSKESTGVLGSCSTLIPVPSNPAEKFNGITTELTQASSLVSDQALEWIEAIADMSDYAIAFNAEFDAPLVDALIGEQNWLCAMRDFDWGYPNSNKTGGYKLTDLALWLGIGISTVHRAADDVRLLVECLNRRINKLPEMLELAIVRSNSPVHEVQALVSYENRDLAKLAGFEWKSERRAWLKNIRECDFSEIDGFPFDVKFK